MSRQETGTSLEKIPFARAKTEILAMLDDLYAAPKLLQYTKRRDFPLEVLVDSTVKDSALSTILKLDQLIGSMGQPIQRSLTGPDQKREKHLTTLHAEKLQLLGLCRGVIVDLFHLRVPSVMFELIYEVVNPRQRERIEALRITERLRIYQAIETWALHANTPDGHITDEVLDQIFSAHVKIAAVKEDVSGERRVASSEKDDDSQARVFFDLDDPDMAALQSLRGELTLKPKQILLRDRSKKRH